MVLLILGYALSECDGLGRAALRFVSRHEGPKAPSGVKQNVMLHGPKPSHSHCSMAVLRRIQGWRKLLKFDWDPWGFCRLAGVTIFVLTTFFIPYYKNSNWALSPPARGTPIYVSATYLTTMRKIYI